MLRIETNELKTFLRFKGVFFPVYTVRPPSVLYSLQVYCFRSRCTVPSPNDCSFYESTASQMSTAPCSNLLLAVQVECSRVRFTVLSTVLAGFQLRPATAFSVTGKNPNSKIQPVNLNLNLSWFLPCAPLRLIVFKNGLLQCWSHIG